MTPRIDPELLQEAAAWRARLAAAGDPESEELSSWLSQDARHREAWRAVQEPWTVLGQHAAAPAVIELRRAALTQAHNAVRGNFFRSKRYRRPATLAAVAAGVLAAGSFLFWSQYRPQVFQTGFGERRVVTLSDGSQVTLDSRSEVTVRYTADTRALTLVRGQAQFDVAHDILRPFAVTADGHKVIATGTAFDVDLLGPKLLVTLLKGHVVILRQSAAILSWIPNVTAVGAGPATTAETGSPASGATGKPTDRIYLDPGEQLVVSSSGVAQISRVDVDRVTAWERGEVVFENEPLLSVIQRMNRYGTRHILIGDDHTGSLRISGVFHEGDIDGFVSTVAAYLSVTARERPDGDVVLTHNTTSLTP